MAYLGLQFKGGGGLKYFWKSGVRESTRLLGGFVGMHPRENFKK